MHSNESIAKIKPMHNYHFMWMFFPIMQSFSCITLHKIMAILYWTIDVNLLNILILKSETTNYKEMDEIKTNVLHVL
jgi:hypothetical protein